MSRIIIKEEAILSLNPNAVYVCVGEDLDTCELTWLENTTPISKADIQAEMDRLQAIEDNA